MKSRLEETDKPETKNNEVGQRTEAYNRAAMLYARVMNSRNLTLKQKADMLFQAEADIEKALLSDMDNADYRLLQEAICTEMNKINIYRKSQGLF